MLISTIPTLIVAKPAVLAKAAMRGLEDGIDWGGIIGGVIDQAGNYLTAQQKAESDRAATQAELARQAQLSAAQLQSYQIKRTTTPSWMWIAGAAALGLGAFYLIQKKGR